jgi:Ca2+-binding RTX toxin-like protein
MLKYANLQVAAEALYNANTRQIAPALLTPGNTTNLADHYSGPINPAVLTDGNEHATKFTAKEAADFAAQWEVVDHISNTTTGFSGTLFKNRANPNELVLSFRSTEFVDDAARDSLATNALEIKETGWAWGQISDMEAWYATLKNTGLIPPSVKFDVTGYSLGGHLATAFNLLHNAEINQVVTFNGAGVGKTLNGETPASVIAEFIDLRSNPEQIQSKFINPELRQLYVDLCERLSLRDDHKPNADDYILLGNITPLINATEYEIQIFNAEKKLLSNALDNLVKLKNEVARLLTVSDAKDGAPAAIPQENIAQNDFAYLMAVQWAATNTEALSTPAGAWNTVFGKTYNNPPLTNQYDIVGKEVTPIATYMVANSQYHHGQDMGVFIEDQPLVRGAVIGPTYGVYVDTGALMLINEYSQNNFGDTHSLMLIVDSLNAQNALLNLLPESQRNSTATQEMVQKILINSSVSKADSKANAQGKAEGDVLENVLNSLGIQLLGPKEWDSLCGDLDGNTWHELEGNPRPDADGHLAKYTGRNDFYDRLNKLVDSEAYDKLQGSLAVTPLTLDQVLTIKEDAYTDFTRFAALYSLSPFLLSGDGLEDVFQAAWGERYTKWEEDQKFDEKDREDGKATYSDTWYDDRSNFLKYWLQAAKENPPFVVGATEDLGDLPDTAQRVYKQLDSGQKVIVRHYSNPLEPDTSSDKQNQYYLFGGKDGDKLTGGDLDDHLYGMGGNDTLIGGEGKDYLEGGEGYDTYIVDNLDTIYDEDGSGCVILNGNKLGEARRKQGDPVYRDDYGNTFHYTEGKDGNKGHLIINGSLNIEKYDNGDLEIVLVEKPGDPMEPIRDKTRAASKYSSPIILDLDGDGIETTSIENGTHFDHAADGFAELTGWVGKDDGLLVRDLNGNGQIDTGRELFGSETLLANGNKAANGFEALKELDSNHDGKIDAQDAAFAELRVWKDANGNGRVDEGELLTLAEAGVQSINLAYTNSNTVDPQGNAHKQIGSYTTTDGQTRQAEDVWFVADPMYSIATEQVDVPADIAALPTARGYGKVRDLHQAMAMDASGQLKALVTAFTQTDSVEDRMALVRQIIYRWTDVQDINPASRINMAWTNKLGDGRKLEALEAFLGEEFRQGNWGANPGPDASYTLNEAYKLLEALVYGQLMMQSHLKGLFEQIAWLWDAETQSAIGDLTWVAQMIANQIEADRGMGLGMLGDLLDALKGMGRLDDVGLDAFKAALLPLGADVAQIFDTALANWVSSNIPNDGNNLLRGTEFDDLIDGKGGNDLIFGRGGNDTLIGGSGNDTLDGGAGDDLLKGGTGSDTYRFGRGDGHDTISEYSGQPGETDRIELKAGITPDDVRLERVDFYDLKLTIRDTGETITVKSHFYSSVYFSVEEIVFADGTVWDMEAIKSQILIGGDGDDQLLGFDGRDDILDGGAGNDTLKGGTGSDTYIFGRGDGHDTIIESSSKPGDTDRIQLKAGITPDDVRLEHVRIFSNGWLTSDDLKLTIRDTGETITVKNHFSNPTGNSCYAIEEIVFADGTVWDMETILSRVLTGEDSNDIIHGFDNRDDLIVGGAGNDVLMGYSGNDMLLGGEGNDTLIGGSGDDTLIGGAGNDILEGGAGSDTYRFGLGDGQDEIIEGDTSGEDVLELGPGITPDDITVRWTLNGDLSVTLQDGSRVIVRGQAYPWSNQRGIEQLRFADGTTWDRDEIATRAIQGTDGDDTIVGNRYTDDVFDGGPGDDTFQDGGGYDTYRFGIGDGQDTITDSSGRIEFKAGIDQNDIAFTRDGNDLIATIAQSGDAIRIKDWLSSSGWQRIDCFDFANGASLSFYDVLAKLNVSEGSEILYGTPGNDTLIGTEKDSTIYGREGDDLIDGGNGDDKLYGEAGDDTLIGGAGSDTLYGGAGDDDLDGGPGRDWLYGGEGNNIYRVTPGMGLDTAYGASLIVAEDTVVFAPGIEPEDVTVQLGDTTSSGQPGDVGYRDLVIGIGGDDALVISNADWQDLGRGAIQHFSFVGGTQWTLADLIARADGGKLGGQEHRAGDPTTIIGSAGDDWIYSETSESLIVRAGANNDSIHLEAGNDTVSAGSGDDTVVSGAGDDLIAGETGDDWIEAGEGDDTILFNYGDGRDVLFAGEGMDTLSFGVTITPDMLSVRLNNNGYLVLAIDGGAGGEIALGTYTDDLPNDLERLQFIDAEGKVRLFDFTGWLEANRMALYDATSATPLAFDGAGFELTGTVAPVGGLEAVAYAQTGDLFGTPYLPHNTPTDGDDVIYGTPGNDVLEAGAGNDIVLGLAGNDTIFGGAGDDILDGGDGDDILDGGAGNDTIFGGYGADTLIGGTGSDELFGGWGGDTYLYQAGDGQTLIDDDHHVLNWGYAGEWGDYGGAIVDDAPNILSFGPGIRPEDLRYAEHNGDLVITFANQPGDKVILRGYEPSRATQTRSVDIIYFADGTEIVADSIDIRGRSEIADYDNAWLYGTQFADTLIGGDGDDWFDGRGGADRLAGGAGSDTYYFFKREGRPAAETQIAEIWRPQDTNRIILIGGLKADDLRLAFDGRDLLLRYTPEGDTIRFLGFDPRDPNMPAPIQEISLPWETWEGVTLSFEELLARGVDYGDDPGEGEPQGPRLINRGDGEILIEEATGAFGDILRFGPGIDADAIRNNLRFESDGKGGHVISIAYGDDGDVLRLAGFDPDDALGSRLIETYEFADGPVLDYETLLSEGFVIEGDGQDNELNGTNIVDRLHGHDGDDILTGKGGYNEFYGGKGDDTLIGGDQVDGYFFERGDGIDTLIDGPSDNFIVFGPGIGKPDLTINWEDDTLVLHYGPGDEIRIPDYLGKTVDGTPPVTAIRFDDGDMVSIPSLIGDSETVQWNTGELPAATEDAMYWYTIPLADFDQSGPFGKARLLNLQQADGSALPGWLMFDAERGMLLGTPTNDDVGQLELRLEIWGDYGLLATQQVSLLVSNTNDAPEVGALLTDQQAEKDVSFTYTLPADSFYDVDVGDVLTYSATLDNGAPLPAWLTFNAETQTFTGTPADGDVGTLQLRVTATDLAGASVSQSFTLDITSDDPGENPTPVTAPDTAYVLEDSLVTGNVLANDTHPGTVTSFRVDGDAAVYHPGESATFAEGTLTLDSHGDYTFTPAQDYAGPVPQVTYTTSSGLSSTLDITVTPVADAPLITVELGEPTQSKNFTIDISNHTRTDQGFTVQGFKSNGDPGVLATFNGGFGVGRYEDPRENPGDAAGEIAYNPTTNTSEKLVVTFDTFVASATVALRQLNTQERALVTAYDGNNNIVFAEIVLGKGDSIDTPVTIETGDGTLISRIEFTAPGMTWHANGSIKDHDDYVVKSISHEGMTVRPINTITVTPTDIDHSEQVTGITLSLPDGVLLSAGTNNGDGSWTLPMENDGNYVCTVDPVTGAVSIAGLEMWIPPGFSGEVTIEVTATVFDRVVVGLDTLVDTGVFDSAGTGMVLMGSSGDDVLVGGGGNDILIGGAGDDIYVFSIGDGQDLIHDNQGANTVRFLDVNSDEIALMRRGDDLTILYGESDSVTIQDHFADATYQMASYAFADVTLVGVDLAEMYGM